MPTSEAMVALHWFCVARSPSHDGRRCAGPEDTRCQNSRNRSTRCAGALPAMSAALMAPIDTPAIQCGCRSVSLSAAYTPAW
ncbi:hypothetical protein D3C72_1199000 [compost metagenome]